MYGLLWWSWLILGMVPYVLKRRSSVSGGYIFELRALFWSMTISVLPKKRTQWVLNLGIIQQLRCIVWNALRQLTQEDDASRTPN